MKKIRKWILLPLILLLSGNSYGQAPSDSIYYNRLFYTCKVWGHVKYYHTEVAKGNINWDDALLDALPGIKEAPDNKSFNDSLQLMINRAGEMEVSSDALPENVDSLNNNSDYSWIQNSIFSESVKEQLEIIRNRFRPQTNVYISKNVVISFDRDTLYYSDSDYPSESMRILALYRYWNIIHYFFPYKYIMDQDWGKTLTEFIPPIIKATNALSYTLTFKKLSTRINDSHGYLSSPTLMKWEPHSYHYPPFHIRFIENETVIMHVKEEFTDVKTGDIVKKIDGIDIYTLRDSFRQYAHGSNDVFIDKQVSMMVWRGYAGSFQIKVDDGLNIKDVYPERVDYETFVGSFTPPEKSWSNTIINGDAHIGIVNLAWLLP